MTETLASQTLAQIVKENHRAANVFEKYDLDFCCKGKRSLEQACSELQLSLTEIEKELETALAHNNTNNIDFDSLTLPQLIEHILNTHHVYVRNEIPQLYAYLYKIFCKHGERHPALQKIFEIFSAVKEDMEAHMQKEELILFPRMLELQKMAENKAAIPDLNIGYWQQSINVMEHEHDHAGELLHQIRKLTNNYTPPSDACTTYRLSFAALQAFEIDLHQHVHLENNVLFPKSIALYHSLQASLN